jgi:hypothetical protein
MISRLLLWIVFLITPVGLFIYCGIGYALVAGISITILLQIFANEETRDIRERQIKFIDKICKKYNIENKE